MARNKVIHIHSVDLNADGNGPKLPASGVLEKGEIAVNYLKDNETIAFENSEGEVVQVAMKSDLKNLDGYINTVEQTGTGNVVTDVTQSDNTLTVTKGANAATQEWVEQQGYAKESEFKGTLNINLKSNQSGASYKDDLIGATITVMNGSTLYKTETWNGEQISFTVKSGVTLSVSVSEVSGYRTPASQSWTAIEGSSTSMTFEYDTEIVSVSLASNQDTTGADVKGATITVNGSNVGTWQGTALTAKVPFDTTYSISSSAVTNYKTPSSVSVTAGGTGGGASRNVTLTYNTEVVTISLSTNQSGETVPNGTSVKVMNGTTELHSLTWQGTALTAKVAYDVSYTVVVGDVTNYKTPTMDARKAQAATNSVSLTYQTEVVAITVTATGESSSTAVGQVITVNGTAYTYKEPFSVKIPFGTSYSISANSKDGYATPATITRTASEATKEITMTYVYAPSGVYIYMKDGSLVAYNTSTKVALANTVGVLVSDGTHKFVVAPTYDTNRKTWSSNTSSVISGVTTTTSVDTAKTDWNGYSNTQAMLKVSTSTSYAAGYCAAYKFNNDKYGYLPSFGESWLIYSNYDKVKTALSNITGASAIPTDYCHWSSTQGDSTVAWRLYWDDGSYYDYGKSYSHYVRAVCAF